jgi:hypothetical protein
MSMHISLTFFTRRSVASESPTLTTAISSGSESSCCDTITISPPHHQKEIAKIKEAATKAIVNRRDTVAGMRKELSALELEQKDLEKRIEQQKQEIRLSDNNQELVELRRILPYIEPRATQIPSHNLDSFLRGWIQGQTADEYFTTDLRY